MSVPGKMPIKGEAKIFHFVAGCQTRTTVSDIDGWKSAQISFLTKNNLLKFENANFKSIRMKVFAKACQGMLQTRNKVRYR